MTNPGRPFALVALSLATAAMGIYAAYASDKPGSSIVGFLLLFAAVVFAVKAARNQLPIWARRTAVVLGALVAASAAFLIHSAAITAPLFGQSSDVPSVTAPPASPQSAPAVDRARPMVRSAIVEQNLPGVSIAVGMDGGIVWAEGFGWRDVVTRAPVTPETRFNIGTAAQVVTPAAAASLGLTHTGTDTAAEWSPGHIGEPEEDFPGFTGVHEIILRPLGIGAPAKPLPGDRATFYVPTTFWRDFSADPRSGRRLMYMRDLACCAEGKTFYSTPADLVRFALAAKSDSVNGELAGGRVMSLLSRRDKGIVVAVASNIAYADTAALAQKVAAAFAELK